MPGAPWVAGEGEWVPGFPFVGDSNSRRGGVVLTAERGGSFGGEVSMAEHQVVYGVGSVNNRTLQSN